MKSTDERKFFNRVSLLVDCLDCDCTWSQLGTVCVWRVIHCTKKGKEAIFPRQWIERKREEGALFSGRGTYTLQLDEGPFSVLLFFLFPITSSEHIRTLNRFLSVSSYTKNYAHSSAEPNCCCCWCQSSKPAWIQFGKQQSAMKIGKNKAVNRSITARLRSTSFYWMVNLISVMTQRTREKRALTSLTTILFLQHPFNEA